MARYGKEFVQSRFEHAIAKEIKPTFQLGQQAPTQQGRWEILRSAHSSLGEQSLGEGATEEAAWDDARENISNAEWRETCRQTAAVDGILQGLKKMAIGGSNEGPHADQGTLLVISQIEQTGEYRQPQIIGALLELGGGFDVLTAEEKAAGKRYLAEKGWTVEQGRQYAMGYMKTAGLLNTYKAKK